MEKKLFLLDAFALIFRAYFALSKSPRITSNGKNTNAQFGFLNTLIELIKNQKPSHLAVCFDTKEPTERHTDYEHYKANRQETPEDILLAVPDIKRILEAFNIPIVEVPGYEADDIIGTLSVKASKEGYEVYMVTSDKDYGQLVSDKVFMYKPASGFSKQETLGVKEVCEKWDIENVSQVIDILGMMGDAVDNIPGIKGVGEKTAAKLLKEYGTLENVLENADNIKGSIGEKVRNGKADAIMSKKLATIILDVPCEFHEESFLLSEWNQEALSEIFNELEFRTIGKRLLGDSFQVKGNEHTQKDLFGSQVTPSKTQTSNNLSEQVSLFDTESITLNTIDDTPHEYHLVDTFDKRVELIGKLNNHIISNQEICFDTETTGLDANLCELVGMSFSIKEREGYYIPFSSNRDEVMQILNEFKPLFDKENILWIGQNIKYDLLVLMNYGFQLNGKLWDTMLAHYCFEPDGKRSMDILSEKFLKYKPVSIEDLIGKKGKGQGTMRDVELDKIKEYASEDADITLQLKHAFEPIIKEHHVDKVFYEVDSPLVKVLMKMEFEGIKIDTDFLGIYSKELEREAKIAEEKVYADAGVRFNLASPKQLGEVLFEKLKLDPKAKKTKTGQYATGEDVLAKLANQHEICNTILTFREYTKLQNTYVDTLPQLINPKTGRVHTTFAQTIAVTGRLSSINPNLQNIPIRTERGREIRKAFIPRDENHILISADYSQIELRVVAAMSGDPAMCEAFQQHKDIHTATAAKVYNVNDADVTKEMRYKAKSVNFGIIYGQGAFGLADNLSISRTEAKEIIDNYKKEFAGIQKFMDDTINFARENGYVETLMGRKRWLRDITSSNFTVRSFAERNAINSPIQGSAADMIKLAMIKINTRLEQSSLKSKMVLQVHDELVFDAVKEEVDELKELILDCMQTAMILPNNVPVVAEVGVGENWLLAH
ncbi:MAG TPA: DNA polymerase I [Chitinophagaceae bacterium]|mgnify:CR=1 FL=1|nr:DNA polymerase I [Chitinophagaceae bacterium]